MPTMPFGKHKGRPLSDVPTDYLEWLLREEVMKSRWWEEQIEMELEIRQDLDSRMGHGRRQAPEHGVPVKDAIRRWYSRMALKYHPDRGGSDEAMRVINHAYEDLQKELATQHRSNE